MLKGYRMALKVLQVVGAAAVVVIVLLLIPVLLRLRRTIGDVGQMVAETRPQTVILLKKAQLTLDGVNRELTNIETITEDTGVLVAKVSDASSAIERAIKSPASKIGFATAGAAAAAVAVKRRLFREMSGKG
jgi:ABC-type transporter Mla subunit MlaD